MLTHLFPHSFEADFLQELSQVKERKLAQNFNFSFRHIDDVLSLNNVQFGDSLHLKLEIKDTTHTPKFASYFDLDLILDNRRTL